MTCLIAHGFSLINTDKVKVINNMTFFTVIPEVLIGNPALEDRKTGCPIETFGHDKTE